MSSRTLADPRSVVPNRYHLGNDSQVVAGIPVSRVRNQTEANADNAAFAPVPDAIHICVPTLARAWVITEAAVEAYHLQVGDGIQFWIQNNSAGANTITITTGGVGQVATGAGTLSIAQANTRHFILTKTAVGVHTLTTTGTLAH